MDDFRFSYRKKDNGVQIILSYKDANGKWRQKTRQGFKTEKAAKQYKDSLLLSARQELEAVKSSPALSIQDFFELHYLPDKEGQLAYNTIQTYKGAIARFHSITSIPFSDLTPSIITTAIAELEKSTSPQTIKFSFHVLKQVTKYAVTIYGLLPRSPFDKVSYTPRKKLGHVNALTREELRTVLSKLHSTDLCDYTMACLGAFAGLRYGEITGLRWNDIDFGNHTISVRQQYRIRKDSTIGSSPLKTVNSYRTIPISDSLLPVLAEWLSLSDSSDLLFPPQMVNYQKYRAHLLRILPAGFCTHSFRHTFATFLLQSGADVKTVSALLGDTVATVIKTYLNYTDDMRKAAVNFVNLASNFHPE